MKDDLRRALREFQDYADDVQRSGFQTFDDSVKRMLSILEPTTPIGALAHRILPRPDFEDWYEAALAQSAGRYGSLNWPPVNADRIVLQLDLLGRVAEDRIDLWKFCHTFLTRETKYDDMVHSFSSHVVRPFVRDLIRLLHTQPEMNSMDESAKPVLSVKVFVEPGRITDLQASAPGIHDVAKLVRLCEELNTCYGAECYLAVAMLTRSVLDHVPPFFGFRAFNEVVANYPWGPSRKDAMDHLQNSARKIADVHLHTRASGDEVLPNQAQVNFGPTLDVLLGEVVRLRKRPVP
ncbi:MAG: hypothetical protein M3541_13700 [Acidobacteriota bacterium]|nr:hypothetical protein [Acidobacteriota bacterium]MDQ3419809.1 hypothetical protein [Acidobacteriota bacterium]